MAISIMFSGSGSTLLALEMSAAISNKIFPLKMESLYFFFDGDCETAECREENEVL